MIRRALILDCKSASFPHLNLFHFNGQIFKHREKEVYCIAVNEKMGCHDFEIDHLYPAEMIIKFKPVRSITQPKQNQMITYKSKKMIEIRSTFHVVKDADYKIRGFFYAGANGKKWQFFLQEIREI